MTTGRTGTHMKRYGFLALAIFTGLWEHSPAAQGASGQNLFFLTGTLGAASAARLYRVGSNSPTPQPVRKVAAEAALVLADYDRRKLIVVSPYLSPHNFDIVDMAAPAVQRHLSIGYDSNELLPAGIYLLDLPVRGLSVAMALGKMFKMDNPEPPRDLSSVSLTAPDAAQVSLPLTDLAFLRVSGLVGGAVILQAEMAPEVGGTPLQFPTWTGSGVTIDIPWRGDVAPSTWSSGPDPYRLTAVNDSVAVLTPLLVAQSNLVDVLDKAAGSWHRYMLPFAVSRARAFGPWVAAIRTEPRNAAWSALKRTSVAVSELQKFRSSPGREKRLTENIKDCDSPHCSFVVEDLFNNLPDYYPGDLSVLNGRTGQILTIHTGQGDSEVVLATDDAVYYRVNDALYRADLAAGKLGSGIKIAEGPDIVQAHWAFLGPAGL